MEGMRLGENMIVSDKMHKNNLRWYREGGKSQTHCRARDIISTLLAQNEKLEKYMGLVTKARQNAMRAERK